jgi:hypothetical protein
MLAALFFFAWLHFLIQTFQNSYKLHEGKKL